MKEPYCAICASPEVDTEHCLRNHADDYYNKVNVIGVYYQKRYMKGDLLSEHILQLKKDSAYAEPLGKSMSIVAKEIYPDLLESDGFVPIPAYVSEYYERGFNQALELSKVLKQVTNIPIVWALEKTRVHRQSGNFRARREGVESLFSIQYPERVRGKKLVIIDDVFTSGGTCSEAAKMLKLANAKSVRVFAAGRANFERGY